ncbi:hypothetical protein MPH_10242 [Macrophomina phaseolina MS6]|uniref:Uncharacterized protein n=1 Tax=Macrophomina phaseolina (strain MS6) TaxID=1126212 RepID=K2RIC6_MACPH|nr:hypothetical protein MPH_10242 [Macrophomina phaseolina MS6]
MSLYYEAAGILQNQDNAGGSLTSRIYGKKGLKSKPAAIYALVTESTKWSAVLKDVVENSGILKLEKKVDALAFHLCPRPALRESCFFTSRPLSSLLSFFKPEQETTAAPR